MKEWTTLPNLATRVGFEAAARGLLFGRVVREAWITWAREQPDVDEHPSWLIEWPDLPERDREVDRRIGNAIVIELAAYGLLVDPAWEVERERLTDEANRFAVSLFAAEAEVERLTTALRATRDELSRWGMGDFHYGSMPQEQRVVDAVAVADAVLAGQPPASSVGVGQLATAAYAVIDNAQWSSAHYFAKVVEGRFLDKLGRALAAFNQPDTTP